jgi:N-methylhydantoinase A/oxoprolinase/acetone carboxylase beta subunit
VLNARLINLLERLITATQNIMSQQGLICPLMVVKGDGSLLHADFALSRPVETVLSGPGRQPFRRGVSSWCQISLDC